MKGSYAYLYANCAELYDREFASESSSLDPNVIPAGPENLDFWPKLISLVESVIEEDKSIYTQVLNQYEPLLDDYYTEIQEDKVCIWSEETNISLCSVMFKSVTMFHTGFQLN